MRSNMPSTSCSPRAEYQVFGRAYDLEILKMKENFWLNVLHLHGSNVMFDRFLDYPLEIVNWHDRETWPSLKKLRDVFPASSAADSVVGRPWCLAHQEM